jgi:DNA transposition AAA+ family ATPase
VIPKHTKMALRSMGLPTDGETIRRARAFVVRSGLTLSEFAEMAGVNPNSLRVFMSGCYDRHHPADSNTLVIRAAVKQTIDLWEIQHTDPANSAHYDTAEFRAMRESMLNALHKGNAMLFDGPPGVSKTYTARRVSAEINKSGQGRAVYVYARMGQPPASFLSAACIEAGIPSRGTLDQLMRKLRYLLGSQQRALLTIDEAQHLPSDTLEVIRQLLDEPPFFGVVLCGSDDLAARLRHWQMERWRSRVRRAHLLTGLTRAEAAHILASELGSMSKQDAEETVADAVVTASREGKEFKYISARNLFFAIDDARSLLANAAQKVEACA